MTLTDPVDSILSDVEARRIASSWHGGGGSALYAFTSTGAIDTARADHDLIAEITDNLTYVERAWQDDDNRGVFTPDDVDELQRLLDYVLLNGPRRGPVAGWGDLNW